MVSQEGGEGDEEKGTGYGIDIREEGLTKEEKQENEEMSRMASTTLRIRRAKRKKE